MPGDQENHPDQPDISLHSEGNWWIRFLLIGMVITLFSPANVYSEEEASSSEAQASTIMSRWLDSWSSIHSFRAKIKCIQYNDPFQTARIGVGEIGFDSSSSGYLQLQPDLVDDSNRTTTRGGVTYTIEGVKTSYVSLAGDCLKTINHADKEYIECQSADFESLTLRAIRDSLTLSLSLPDNRTRIHHHGWSFQLTRETEDRSFVRCQFHGKHRFLSLSLSHLDLCFNKNTNELTAIQYVSPASKTVYFFSDVELNPTAWPMPDLTGYENISLKLIE